VSAEYRSTVNTGATAW